MTTAHRSLAALSAVFCSTFLALTATASEPRLILKGHDPVAYFTEGKPVKGSAQYAYDWDEGRYYFASASNRALFVGDPDHYAPRFGGHCAGSITRGVKNEGDPSSWVIVDSKLYVFGRPMTAEELAKYPARIPQANAMWPKVNAK